MNDVVRELQSALEAAQVHIAAVTTAERAAGSYAPGLPASDPATWASEWTAFSSGHRAAADVVTVLERARSLLAESEVIVLR